MDTMSDKLVTIANNMEKIYQSGKSDYMDHFWDVFQQNGERTYYSKAFRGFDFTTFWPKYDIIPVDASGLFEATSHIEAGSLKQRLDELEVKLDTSKCRNLAKAFYNTNFTEIPTIDLTGVYSSESYNNTKLLFAYNQSLETIEKIIINAGTYYNDWFDNSFNIANLTFEGVIGTSNFKFDHARALTHESLVNIIDALADYSHLLPSRDVIIDPNTYSYVINDNTSTVQWWGALNLSAAPNNARFRIDFDTTAITKTELENEAGNQPNTDRLNYAFCLDYYIEGQDWVQVTYLPTSYKRVWDTPEGDHHEVVGYLNNEPTFLYALPLNATGSIYIEIGDNVNISQVTGFRIRPEWNWNTLLPGKTLTFSNVGYSPKGAFTVKFGSDHLAKLSDEEKAQAVWKGWTLA